MCVPLCSQDLRDPFLFGISLIWQPLRVWLSFIEMSLELDAWKPESEGLQGSGTAGVVCSESFGLWNQQPSVLSPTNLFCRDLGLIVPVLVMTM